MNRFDESIQRHGLWYAATGFVVTRAIVLIAAYAAPQHRADRENVDWWSDVPLARWDSGHYGAILEEGYPPGPPVPERVAFFPGYPLVARPFAGWFGVAGALVFVSHVASLIGVIFVYLWARRRTDPRTGFWCVILLAAYPPAMFLSAGYADALLFLCTGLILWLLDRQQVGWAACVSGLATAVRPTGLVLALVVTIWAWLYAPACGWPRRLVRVFFVGCVSVTGIMAYEAYLWHRYQRPDAYFATQAYWPVKENVSHPVLKALTLHPVVAKAWRPFKYALRGQFERFSELRLWNPLLNLLILVLGVRGLVRPGRIPRVLFLLPILVFAMAYLPDPVTGGRLLGIARYQLMALPCFLLVAEWATRRDRLFVFGGLLAVFLVMQCLYVCKFVDWRMVG